LTDFKLDFGEVARNIFSPHGLYEPIKYKIWAYYNNLAKHCPCIREKSAQ
jgi:hypothetical protein